MLTAYVNTKCKRADGTYDCYQTQQVPVKVTEIPRKGQTLSGYGRALPTRYMVQVNGKWQRVKAVCFSNAATLYIGPLYSECTTITVEEA